jgi:hypothetical protein
MVVALDWAAPLVRPLAVAVRGSLELPSLAPLAPMVAWLASQAVRAPRTLTLVAALLAEGARPLVTVRLAATQSLAVQVAALAELRQVAPVLVTAALVGEHT